MSAFTLTTQNNDEDREALLAGLGAYNRQFISSENWGPLSVSHRDTQGESSGTGGESAGMSLCAGGYVQLSGPAVLPEAGLSAADVTARFSAKRDAASLPDQNTQAGAVTLTAAPSALCVL